MLAATPDLGRVHRAKDNTLVFYSNRMYADDVKYFLVRNRPEIKYEIIVDDNKFAGKYCWTGLN